MHIAAGSNDLRKCVLTYQQLFQAKSDSCTGTVLQCMQRLVLNQRYGGAVLYTTILKIMTKQSIRRQFLVEYSFHRQLESAVLTLKGLASSQESRRPAFVH